MKLTPCIIFSWISEIRPIHFIVYLPMVLCRSIRLVFRWRFTPHCVCKCSTKTLLRLVYPTMTTLNTYRLRDLCLFFDRNSVAFGRQNRRLHSIGRGTLIRYFTSPPLKLSCFPLYSILPMLFILLWHIPTAINIYFFMFFFFFLQTKCTPLKCKSIVIIETVVLFLSVRGKVNKLKPHQHPNYDISTKTLQTLNEFFKYRKIIIDSTLWINSLSYCFMHATKIIYRIKYQMNNPCFLNVIFHIIRSYLNRIYLYDSNSYSSRNIEQYFFFY